MKPAKAIAKITAAATALSVTFALVWSMANLGYPGSDVGIAPMAAAPTTTQHR